MKNFLSFTCLTLLVACGAKTSRDVGNTCLRDEDCGEANYCERQGPADPTPSSLRPKTI